MKPHLSIVIPIYNRLNITREGLGYIQASLDEYDALPESSRPYSVNIVIVDDGSKDGSPEWVQANYPSIDVIRTPGDLWWTGSANYGVSYAMKKFPSLSGIIMQNDDVMVEKDWTIAMIAAIVKEPRAVIGCATTTPEQKDVIQFGGTVSHPWFARTKFTNRNRKRSEFAKGHLEPSFYLSGRGLYVPVSVFREIGLFDEKSFKHRGDMDIPLRAKKAGYKLLVAYDAIVYELPQHTFGLDIKKKITAKELYKAMVDFRSSYSLGYIYNYSRIATNNALQFSVFFFCNFSFHMKALLEKYLRQ
jgi:N-acetylglucosaminyl-diphospho-decaprenol L-rhamnosyltransferase